MQVSDLILSHFVNLNRNSYIIAMKVGVCPPGYSILFWYLGDTSGLKFISNLYYLFLIQTFIYYFSFNSNLYLLF